MATRVSNKVMPLLASSAALKLVIRSLDPVVTGFPHLVAARAARATSYHRLWLNSAAVQVQRFRAAHHAYAARFIPRLTEGIERGDAIARYRARRDYLEILRQEEMAEALAGLALLESYGRRHRRAQRQAERAATLSPVDAGIQNDRGVVLALAGQLEAARCVFEGAANLGLGRRDAAPAFNRAKVAALLGTADRVALLETYLELDASSGWSNEARRLLGDSPSRVSLHRVPAPEVRPGVALGTGLEQALARLGPSRDQVCRHDLLVLQYPERGLRLVFGRRRGAIMIELLAAHSGDLHGVRVGDAVAAIGDRWGPASERSGEHAVYWIGRWGIGVEYGGEDGKIETLSLESAG